MLRFEVKSTEVREKKGTATKTGRPYLIREQNAYLDLGKPYPVEVKVNLDDQGPFDVGVYEITKECLYVGRFGDVQLDLKHARRLVPAQQPKVA